MRVISLDTGPDESRPPRSILFVVTDDAPFLVDTAGNAANLYDSIVWWDDVMHFVTWVPWVVGFGLALRYVDGLARWTVFGLTVGFGAVTHIAWELMEYVAFIRTNPDELEGAYRDTMGDLTLSLVGSITGAALCVTVLWTVGRPVAQTADLQTR